MLQQILADMYVDPDILEALNEEQKKILFLKMREEQVRRWKEREEQEEKDGKKDDPRPKKAPYKKVSWLLGRDGDVHVCAIGERDENKSPKLILSELKQQNMANFSNCDRPLTTAPLNISIPKRLDQPDSTKPGIELLLKKSAELKESDTQEKAITSNHSLEESETNQENNSDSSNSALAIQEICKDLQTPATHKRERYMSIADRLSQRALQRGTRASLPVFEQPCLQVALTQEKEEVNDQESSSSFGSRVAQLRRNFNTPNANVPSLCPKPPIPTKPAHLMTAASVR